MDVVPSTTTPNGHGSPARIAYLDGLRGVAIMLVVLFHAFRRWTTIVPYHDQFASVPLFAEGWLGVELFFMISGFVIFMTLDKCASLADFAWRRWLRLFPAMLACSVLIYATAPLLWERPLGAPLARDLLPGLAFIQPEWWAPVLEPLPRALDGSFWSLFVEVKFYAISGLIYFLLGRVWALAAIVSLFFLAAAAKFSGSPTIEMISAAVDAHYYGWFAVGALIYRWHLHRDPKALAAALALALLCPLVMAESGRNAIIGAYLIVLMFFAAELSPRTQLALSNRALLFVGFVSYPLYLLHQNMMVALIIKLGRWAHAIPSPLLPVIPFGIVIGLAWLVARFAEPWIKAGIRRSGRVVWRSARS